MQVLVLTSLFPNNTNPHLGIFVKERVRHLAQHFNVRVIAPIPWFPKVNGFKRWSTLSRICSTEQIDGLMVRHPRYPVIPKFGRVFYGWFYYWALVRFLSKNPLPFELIDSHWVYPDGFAAVLLGRKYNVPVMVTARGSDINLFSRKRLLRLLIHYTLKNANAVIAVSAALKHRMIALGCPEDKIEVIHNGVDPSRFFPRAKTEARSILNLNPEQKMVLAVGNLVSLKRFHLLIDSVAQILAEGGKKSLGLYIIGEGEQRQNLEARVGRLSLQAHVRFVGRVDSHKLHLWYNAADVLALASQSEGCPNVVLESLACGTPVVASGVGGVPELLTPENGILVDDSSSQSFARAIKQALSNAWDKEAIVKHARQYTWERVAEQIGQRFKALL